MGASRKKNMVPSPSSSSNRTTPSVEMAALETKPVEGLGTDNSESFGKKSYGYIGPIG